MFTYPQLSTLLKMQNDMQCAQLGDTWVEETFHNYGRAIAVEACEAMEHVGFKWWKVKEPDMEQLKMELVDILHFELCNAIQKGGWTHTDRSQVMDTSAELCREFHEIEEGTFDKHLMLIFLDDIAKDALDGDSILYVLMQAFKLCGLTGDDVFKLYVGKNVLNSFRKNNGYKEGGYIKTWNGMEDNEVLTAILYESSGDIPDFENVLYKKLESTYIDVKLLAAQ